MGGKLQTIYTTRSTKIASHMSVHVTRQADKSHETECVSRL